MSHRSIRIGFCLALAFAMALGTLLSAAHVASGHNAYAAAQAEAVRHAELATTIAEHGHAHDEGEPAERVPGHVHGHNSADHLHETANALVLGGLAPPSFEPTTVKNDSVLADPGHPDGLERPPRPVVAA